MIEPGAKKVSIPCVEHWHEQCLGHLGLYAASFKCQCECHEEKMAQHVSAIFFFPNGNATAFDSDGKQVPTPHSWLIAYVEHLRAQGVEVNEQTELLMPNGKMAHLFRTSDGRWSWEFKGRTIEELADERFKKN